MFPAARNQHTRGNLHHDGLFTRLPDHTARRLLKPCRWQAHRRSVNGSAKVGMFEHSHSAMLLIDPETGAIVDANSAAAAFYGWSRETIRQMNIGEINTLDQTRLKHRLDQARQPSSSSFVFQHRLADGSIREVQVVSGPVDYQGRELLYSIILDATPYLAALKALKQSEQRFQRLVDAAPDAIFVHADLNLLYANRQTAELLGFEHESALLGQPVFDFVHPDHQPLARTRISQMTEAGTAAPPDELVMLRFDSSPVHVEVSSVPIDYEGQPAILVIARDLTRRRRGNERLRLASTVFENTGEGIIITDTNSRIIGVNRAFSEITGYAESEVLGQSPKLLSSDQQDRDFYRRLWRDLRHNDRWQGEIWNRRKDGSLYPQLTRINAIRDEHGKLSHYVAVLTDLSEVHDTRQKLEHLYHHDLLTELPNRLMFRQQLKRALAQLGQGGEPIHVLHVDLDGFKHINESMGLLAGDQVLREAARRLRAVLKHKYLVARIGADEFAVLLTQGALVEQLAEQVRKSLAEPITVNDRVLFATASVGVASGRRADDNPESVLQQSDAASHQAQSEGGNLIRHYRGDLGQYAHDRVLLAAQLRQAIQTGELIMHYQPQVELGSFKVVGMEALVRWPHPELGLLPPDRFIPIAEDTGLVIQLGRWALAQACRQARQWRDAGIEFGRVSVNVSGVQVQRGNLKTMIEQILLETRLPAACLELELTESFVMGTGEASTALLRQLKQLGLALAIDDFGTGYSSMACLKELPFDTLKIDQSFVRALDTSERDVAICRAIVALGQALGFRTIAEGVENEGQRQRLLSLGCRYGQGFLFDRAVQAEQVPAVIDNINRRQPPAAQHPGPPPRSNEVD